MMKYFNDTLKFKGIYSQKRTMTFASFVVATVYGFIPLFKPGFEVKEFVFLGFLGLGGFTIYRTQRKNTNLQNNNDGIEEN